ncbi:MAG TPA: hypothetical protein VG917_00435 [Patescibacteria group bacterium]|nr:hypothetical protein [Patescibacteria group bacterium]
MLEQFQNIENRQNTSLINEWINTSLPFIQRRDQMVRDLQQGLVEMDGSDIVFTSGLRAPKYLAKTMMLWANEGPLFLGSYCHPEQFDLYTATASINASLFLKQLATRGRTVDRHEMAENWYETVALDRTLTTPFSYGDIFGVKNDFLGLGGVKYGTEPLSIEDQQDLLEQTDCMEISTSIVGRLSTEILNEQNTIGLNRPQKKMQQEAIASLVSSRLQEIKDLAASSLEGVAGQNPRIDDFLMIFEQKFFGKIIKTQPIPLEPRLSDIVGIESTLFSNNRRHLSLIFKTLEILNNEFGPQIFKKLIESSSEGLFFGNLNGRETDITVADDTKEFILRDRKTGAMGTILSDDSMIGFVRDNNFLPLAKSEMLAVASGATTLHMGSEHGNREKVLDALGINKDQYFEFRSFMNGMRVGQDLEQGHPVIKIEGVARFISPILLYALLGKDFLRSRILAKSGTRDESDIFTNKEFRVFCAKELVKLTTPTDLI